MAGLVLLGIVVLLVVWAIASYNRLVGLRNQVLNGWRQIDVQLKRRHDLIPEPGQRRARLDGLRARHADGRHGRAREGADRDRSGRRGRRRKGS